MQKTWAVLLTRNSERLLTFLWLPCRLEWDVQRAARNALRLHAASLPALACALLLIRLAFLTCPHTCLSSKPALHLCSGYGEAAHQTQNLLQQSSSSTQRQKVPRGPLYCIMLLWAATASWLWPQLAIAVGWISHRRPSLPSVMWSAFLLLLTEGLLEASDRITEIIAWCAQQLMCRKQQCPSTLPRGVRQIRRQSWLR